MFGITSEQFITVAILGAVVMVPIAILLSRLVLYVQKKLPRLFAPVHTILQKIRRRKEKPVQQLRSRGRAFSVVVWVLGTVLIPVFYPYASPETARATTTTTQPSPVAGTTQSTENPNVGIVEEVTPFPGGFGVRIKVGERSVTLTLEKGPAPTVGSTVTLSGVKKPDGTMVYREIVR